MADDRLAADQARLRQLAAASRGLLVIEREVGRPVPRQYLLRVRCRSLVRLVAGRPEFADDHLAELLLAGDYPYAPPTVEIKTPIFHPHVFPGTNRLCTGSQWRPTEYLDEFVKRLFRILQFDPDVLNASSPANHAAQAWAAGARAQFPLDHRVLGGPAPLRPRLTFRRLQ